MKKLAKLSFIILIPFVLGIGLIVAGLIFHNPDITAVGVLIMSYGMPIIMFLAVVIGLVLMITDRLEDNKPQKTLTRTPDEKSISEDTLGELANENSEQTGEREKEFSELKDINSSFGYESRTKEGEYMMRHTANVYKNSTTKEKILGWLFFGFLMTDFAMILVFAFLRCLVGCIICFSIFGGTILISLIVNIIVEKVSQRGGRKISDTKKLLVGKVKACLLSSASSVGGSRRNSTTRIVGVTYRVVVDVDGKQYYAYSKDFYETGEPIIISPIGRKLAAIVDPEQLKARVDKCKKELDEKQDKPEEISANFTKT